MHLSWRLITPWERMFRGTSLHSEMQIYFVRELLELYSVDADAKIRSHRFHYEKQPPARRLMAVFD